MKVFRQEGMPRAAKWHIKGRKKRDQHYTWSLCGLAMFNSNTEKVDSSKLEEKEICGLCSRRAGGVAKKPKDTGKNKNLWDHLMG